MILSRLAVHVDGSRPWLSVRRASVLRFTVALAAFLVSPSLAAAEGVISRPGAHPEYKVELEPQFVYRHQTPYYGSWGDVYGGANGFGPGVRVAIPIMHQGPIPTINNNIAISFGASLTFHGCYCDERYRATVFNIPVAFQWNFYFTEIISALGELGLNTPWSFYDDRLDRRTQFDIEPLFQVGGRFQFGKVGVVARLGWPVMSVGANFQF